MNDELTKDELSFIKKEYGLKGKGDPESIASEVIAAFHELNIPESLWTKVFDETKMDNLNEKSVSVPWNARLAEAHRKLTKKEPGELTGEQAKEPKDRKWDPTSNKPLKAQLIEKLRNIDLSEHYDERGQKHHFTVDKGVDPQPERENKGAWVKEDPQKTQDNLRTAIKKNEFESTKTHWQERIDNGSKQVPAFWEKVVEDDLSFEDYQAQIK